MKLSIISPSFNQAQFLQTTLTSVIEQDYPDYEYIIQDPGSTDGSRDILEAHAHQSSHVRLEFEKDAGQADAINRGFAKASGEILTWINTDDRYVDTQVLSSVMDVFDCFPEIDVVYGRGNFVNENGGLLRTAFIHENGAELINRLISSVGILQPALFFRASLFRKVGGIDASMVCAFDHELWLRFLASGARFRFLDRLLVEATFHASAKSSALRLRQLLESSEVTRRYYGFASGNWVSRAVESARVGTNHIVDETAERNRTSPARETMDALAALQFRRFNAGNPERLAIMLAPRVSDCELTQRLARRSRVLDNSKLIATTFDNRYSTQGLTLLQSIRSKTDESVPVVVYDMGLSKESIHAVSGFRNVHVVPYPEEAVAAYPDYLAPKNYGYKCAAAWDAARFAQIGGLVLWIDAGVAVIGDLDPIWKRVKGDGVFFVDHDDRPNWPFFNGTFCHPDAAAAIEATPRELFGPHLCSCLFGYMKGGPYQTLFAEAYQLSKVRAAVVHGKHPKDSDVPGEKDLYRHPETLRARRMAAEPETLNSISMEQTRDLLGYLGHRQDQTIFSILASRYQAPIASVTQFCPSTDDSSKASRFNYLSGGLWAELQSKSEVPPEIQSSVTYHHRGVYELKPQTDPPLPWRENLVIKHFGDLLPKDEIAEVADILIVDELHRLREAERIDARYLMISCDDGRAVRRFEQLIGLAFTGGVDAIIFDGISSDDFSRIRTAVGIGQIFRVEDFGVDTKKATRREALEEVVRHLGYLNVIFADSFDAT